MSDTGELVRLAMVQEALTEAMDGLEHLAAEPAWIHDYDGSPARPGCEMERDPQSGGFRSLGPEHQRTHRCEWRPYPPDKGLRLADLTAALPEGETAPAGDIAAVISGVVRSRTGELAAPVVLGRIADAVRRREPADEEEPETAGYGPRCQFCGVAMPGAVRGKRYCKAAHRVAAHKRRKAAGG